MKHHMFRILLLAALIASPLHTHAETQSKVRDVSLLLIVGAPGTDDYEKRFLKQVDIWKEACTKAAIPIVVIGTKPQPVSDTASAPNPETPSDSTPKPVPDAGEPKPATVTASEKEPDLKRISNWLKSAATQSSTQLWLVWIGHGTYDGREAKFNLHGPDITSTQLGEWLKPLPQEIILIQCSSASAPFLRATSGPKRVIITATKDADEVFYTRFGEYFAPAIAGLPAADADQDEQVSLLEAFLYANRKTAEFYEHEGRLATEHALLDDNGDNTGTRAEAFTETNPTGKQLSVADGTRATQIALVLSPKEAALSEAIRTKRDALETRLNALKKDREKLGDERYYTELEKLLRALGDLYSSP